MLTPVCPSWPSYLPSFTSVVQLASEFGPFLFAILFLIVVTRIAGGHFLIASGLVLTALAVGWWVFADWRGDNRYQVTILDLGKDEKITSSYYSHVSPRGDSPIHDDYFLIVQNTPFKVGDKFEFAYSTPPSTGLAGAVVVSCSFSQFRGMGLHRRCVAHQPETACSQV